MKQTSINMAEVHLSVGSNVGDRLQFIILAVDGIKSFCKVKSISSVYETIPWGFSDQDLFLNICLKVITDLKPLELLDQIKLIEKEIGRQKTFKWGPRVIDIDIIMYGQLELQSPTLNLPQKQLEERAFVLVPLREISPDLVHPSLSMSILEMCSMVESSGVKKYKTQPFQ